MTNEIEKTDELTVKYKEYISKYLKAKEGRDDKVKNFDVVVNFNWGGTIAGLWYTYKYCSNNFTKTDYIAPFEEDFKATNNTWYTFSKDLLDKNDAYSYVGETNRTNPHNEKLGIIKYAQSCRDSKHKESVMKNLKLKKVCGCRSMFPEIKECKKCVCGGIIYGMETWTDGGFYFSQVGRLEDVEKRIGIFHKGEQKTKWHHVFDGVELGEVGFPTLLFHNGFSFGSVSRTYFFKHE